MPEVLAGGPAPGVDLAVYDIIVIGSSDITRGQLVAYVYAYNYNGALQDISNEKEAAISFQPELTCTVRCNYVACGLDSLTDACGTYAPKQCQACLPNGACCPPPPPPLSIGEKDDID